MELNLICTDCGAELNARTLRRDENLTVTIQVDACDCARFAQDDRNKVVVDTLNLVISKLDGTYYND